jgi:N,N'-diacetyllegionaminate synthase
MSLKKPQLPFFIAEVGMNHEGSLGTALSYINSLASCGVSAIKFQMHLPEAESSNQEKFRVNVYPQDATRYDYWKRTAFTVSQWQEIKSACDEQGIKFFATPFSVKAVEILADLEIDIWKIPSGEVQNWYLLDAILEKHGTIILSSGMSFISDLDKSVSYIEKRNGNLFSVLQCTSSYPVKPEKVGLNVMSDLAVRYNTVPGLSDHSGRKETNIIASYQGCEVFEFHVRKSQYDFGPDISASINIDQVASMLSSIKYAKRLAVPASKDGFADSAKNLKETFVPKLVCNRNLRRGTVLAKEFLVPRKGDLGIPVSSLHNIIGKMLNADLDKGQFLLMEHLNYD